MSKIALVGKPNSGKSSLFNLLTGLNQKIGNYSGVTVERKTGTIGSHTVIDLPGLKSLRTVNIDEQITRDYILDLAALPSPVLFIANGMMLEDNLLLFSEIADLQIPLAVAINFKDDLVKSEIELDIKKLSQLLGCPVVLMNSRTGEGLEELKSIFENDGFRIPNAVCRSLYDNFESGALVNSYLEQIKSNELAHLVENKDDFFKRQKIIASTIRSSITDIGKRGNYLDKSKMWDKFMLHPFIGLLFFLLTMLIVFQSVFYLAAIPMDWIDQGFALLGEWASNTIRPDWLGDMVSQGIVPGLGGVLIFIPQIAILFFLLGILEHSGYLSRISFISNRFLTKFGLSGQSVVPLMSSWACAIPAIMSTRVITDPKERLAVIMASPLMTCSARLPVYTILIAIMFPANDAGFFNAQGLMLLGLYVLGVLATLLVALLVSKKSKVPAGKLWSLDLPVYRIPNWRNVFYNMYQKTKAFVVDAGKVIFVVSMILWFLASFSPKSEEFLETNFQSLQEEGSGLSREAVDLEYSYAGYLGKLIEPAIEPLGYDWKIGIALISSFAAREVFVGSLSTIYSVGSDEESLIKTRLQNEINLKNGAPRYNVATCLSLLLFYVFALQCMSTMAIVRRETGTWYYPIMQFVLMLVLAYVAAFIGYRIV